MSILYNLNPYKPFRTIAVIPIEILTKEARIENKTNQVSVEAKISEYSV